MTSTASWRRLWLAGVVLALTAGCGAGPSASEQVPKLATSLDRVDAAIAEGDHEAARTLLAELTSLASRAQEGGKLEADQAARILDAAERLLSALPDAPAPVEPEPTPEPSPTESSPTESSEPDLDDEDSEGEDSSDEHEGHRGKGKSKDNGKGKSQDG